MYVFIYLFIMYLFIYYVCMYLFIMYLFIYLFIYYVFICLLCIYLFIYYVFIYLLFIYLLCIYLFIYYVFIYLFIYLFIPRYIMESLPTFCFGSTAPNNQILRTVQPSAKFETPRSFSALPCQLQPVYTNSNNTISLVLQNFSDRRPTH